MKLKIAVFLIIVAAIIFAYAQNSSDDFEQAKDFPRGALLYAQFSDLPEFIRLWENSELKNNYLASENFHQLQNRHLALKILQRWEEFNRAAGFYLDLAALSKMAETRAAIAVYDVGRLDLVFVAPVSDEIFAAMDFIQFKDKFEKIALEDGTIVYSQKFETDGGRQRSQMLFANFKGRFILATDEKTFLRTINVIGGKSEKDSLADAPEFQILTENQTSRDASFWLDQAKLNDDYYFKRYWLMPDKENLKRFRAAFFSLEIVQEKLTERRRFLLNEKQNAGLEIEESEAGNLIEMLPERIAFYNLKGSNERLAAEIGKTLFENAGNEKSAATGKKWVRRDYSSMDFNPPDEDDWRNYYHLGEKFDEKIDERAEDYEDLYGRETFDFSTKSLQEILIPARPKMIVSATDPQMLPAPLFMEFRKISVIKLENPRVLNVQKLENLLAENLKNKLTIADKAANLEWETTAENGKTWRELRPPALGWAIAYALEENNLIFSNSPELLRETLLRGEKPYKTTEKSNETFNELTIINLSRRGEAFDDVMNKIAAEEYKNQIIAPSDDFFAGNVASLLDAAKDVEKIEIRREFSAGILREEIVFFLK